MTVQGLVLSSMREGTERSREKVAEENCRKSLFPRLRDLGYILIINTRPSSSPWSKLSNTRRTTANFLRVSFHFRLANLPPKHRGKIVKTRKSGTKVANVDSRFSERADGGGREERKGAV